MTLIASSAWSQPRQSGQWLPWRAVPAPVKPGEGQVVSPEELASFDAELRALREILQRARGMSAPTDFNVETSGQLLRDRGEPDAPIAGLLTLTTIPVAVSGSPGTPSREDHPQLDFAVNWLPRRMVDPTGYIEDWDGVETDAFRATEVPTMFAGFERYGEALVFMSNGASLWTALGLGDALEFVRASRQLDIDEVEHELEEFRAWSAKIRAPEYRAELLRLAREETKGAPDPEAALASLLSELRGMQEHMNNAESFIYPAAIDQQMRAVQAPLDEVTAWLASLSPGERVAPACFVEGGKTLKERFLPAPQPSCVDLVRPNPALFDSARPRTAPQVLTIGPINGCIVPAPGSAASSYSAACAAFRALIQTLDKDALRAWLQ